MWAYIALSCLYLIGLPCESAADGPQCSPEGELSQLQHQLYLHRSVRLPLKQNEF